MRRFCLTVCALLLVLVGCRAQSGVELSSGEPLSPEEQQSLYQERVEQEGEPDVSVKGKVYWTPKGTKYHRDPNCSYIKNAKELQSGTITQAVNNGAKSPCSRCAGG